ncbi:CLUMA_CG002164, isoform A [Clunio marinus]|uniref:CLUMA_CG002164, isoform A n=1 Tax=Clunio marinus TaxID=568069 RepID=A0A1J1HKD3_9DIPT|nr:CLUMA_CG002164, isoform A [Clunio marinus]
MKEKVKGIRRVNVLKKKRNIKRGDDTVGLDWSSGCDYTTDQTDRRGTTLDGVIEELKFKDFRMFCQVMLNELLNLKVKGIY